MGLNLIGTVSLDGSGWSAGMKQIEHATEKTAEVVKGLVVAAFGVYGIEQAIHKTIEYGEQITDMSRRVGIGIEKLQEFGFAAKMNGAQLEDLVNFIEKLNSARIDPKKMASFEKLGIGAPGNMAVEDLILQLSANVKTRSSQEVIGPLRDIGGRGAGQMLEMLKDDMGELADEAHHLGAIMKREDAVAFKFIGDQMKTLAQIMIVSLAPAILFVFDAIMRAVNGFKADKNFWQTFAKSATKQDWFALITGPFLNEKDPASKKMLDEMKKKFTAAGASSENLLNGLNDAYNAQKDDLLKKQKEIEDINRMPDFDSVEKGGKVKGGKTQPYSDSLLRIGNFLGASQTPMERIAHEHTGLLRKIEANTAHLPKEQRDKSHGSGFGHL